MTGGTGRRNRWMVPALAGAAVLLLDQLTKWWASDALADRTIDLVWTLRLHLVFNTGAAQKYPESVQADLPRIDLTKPVDWSAMG